MYNNVASTKAEAIEQLLLVKDVAGWNVTRDSLKRRISLETITEIDVSGLIVKVLGQDGQKVYGTKAPVLHEFGDDLD